jgi:hypothetical protein
MVPVVSMVPNVPDVEEEENRFNEEVSPVSKRPQLTWRKSQGDTKQHWPFCLGGAS